METGRRDKPPLMLLTQSNSGGSLPELSPSYPTTTNYGTSQEDGVREPKKKAVVGLATSTTTSTTKEPNQHDSSAAEMNENMLQFEGIIYGLPGAAPGSQFVLRAHVYSEVSSSSPSASSSSSLSSSQDEQTVAGKIVRRLLQPNLHQQKKSVSFSSSSSSFSGRPDGMNDDDDGMDGKISIMPKGEDIEGNDQRRRPSSTSSRRRQDSNHHLHEVSSSSDKLGFITDNNNEQQEHQQQRTLTRIPRSSLMFPSNIYTRLHSGGRRNRLASQVVGTEGNRYRNKLSRKSAITSDDDETLENNNDYDDNDDSAQGESDENLDTQQNSSSS